MRFRCLAASIPASALLCVLAGCSADFNPTSLSQTSLALTGNVHGGRQPISGAHVYVLAAGTGGNGGPSIAPSAANASVSLLNTFSTGAFPTTFDAALNAYYVTTDAQGNFALTGEYACTAGQQVYLYTLGGKPDGITANASAALMAILGTCPASGTFATQTPYVVINEVSTIAAAYAFAGYASDATHVSSSGTALALTGIANAFSTAANLADISVGTGARSAPASIAGSVPQTEINALANSIAACVNSGGAASTQCSALFSNVKSAGATGTTATDTATVAINIAHNPSTAVATIFANTAGIGTPFLPTLSVAPNDFTIQISFYSGTLGFPEYVAIDAAGNVWVVCYSSGLSKYAPSGALAPGGGYYTGGGMNHPIYIAIDATGNAWLANQTGGTVSKFSSTGVPANSTGFAGNNDLDPAGIAIDATGNIWVSNYGKNTLSKLDSSGNELAGSPYVLTGLNQPWQIAIDGSGNVWSGNYNVNDIVESTSAGASAGTSPFTNGSYSTPRSVAIGLGGTAWVANRSGNSITHVTPAGVGTNITGGGINTPSDISIDGSGNAWVVNQFGNNLSEFSSTGATISPATGFKGVDMDQPYGLAVDGSGNIWIANASGDNLIEYVGIATPAITPIVTAVSTNAIGTRP
jgi:sugar lactone lactonase YvrE